MRLLAVVGKSTGYTSQVAGCRLQAVFNLKPAACHGSILGKVSLPFGGAFKNLSINQKIDWGSPKNPVPGGNWGRRGSWSVPG
jgi:hypothetical protein